MKQGVWAAGEVEVGVSSNQRSSNRGESGDAREDSGLPGLWNIWALYPFASELVLYVV
jgi:hypothetical protein